MVKALIRTNVKMSSVLAERDDFCWNCGYPFDTGERIKMDGEGRLFCSTICAEEYHKEEEE